MEGGPPRFPQGFSSPTVLRNLPSEAHTHVVYGTFTPSGRPSQWRSTTRRVSQLRGSPCRDPRQALQPPPHNAARLSRVMSLGSSPFARRYLGNLMLISSPPGTEMVQFPGFSFPHLWIQMRMMAIQAIGLPHSAIRGSRDVCSSPRLIAAYHGLLRTAAPRHPPWTLSRLTILSSALQSAAPHAHALRTTSDIAKQRVPHAAPTPTEQLPLRAPHPTPSGRTRASLLRTPHRLSGSSSRCAPLHPSLALSKTTWAAP